MWLQVSVTLFLSGLVLISYGQEAERASLSRSSDPRDGRCQYTFTVAAPADTAGCPMDEMESVLSRLVLLEALVSHLVGGQRGGSTSRTGSKGDGSDHVFSQATNEKNQLQKDKEQLSGQVQELLMRVEQLGGEAETLRQKPCQPDQAHPDHGPSGKVAFGVPNSTYQEMKAEVTEVPASSLIPEGGHNLTGCGELVSVGEPVLHRKADSITGKYGVWFQDPEPPQGPLYTNRTVWRIDTVGKDVRQLFAYEDTEQFSRGFPIKVLVLPEPVESTGATLYRGSLYYQRRRSRTLIRYDLASETLTARRDLPHAGFHGQHPYSWGGYTDIDLAADELGLWAIYSTSRAMGAIVISQLDPESLAVRRSWETNVRKNTVANTFMACGRLYTVASYTVANTTVNHVYDTATGVGRAIAVPFKNKYRYNSMVDYNHAQRKLFAWDNHHMTTYDIILGRAGHGSR